jgi:hypothetical protein
VYGPCSAVGDVELLALARGIGIDGRESTVEAPDRQARVAQQLLPVSLGRDAQVGVEDELRRKSREPREPLRHRFLLGDGEGIPADERSHVVAQRERARLVNHLLEVQPWRSGGSFLCYHASAVNVSMFAAYATSLSGSGESVWYARSDEMRTIPFNSMPWRCCSSCERPADRTCRSSDCAEYANYLVRRADQTVGRGSPSCPRRFPQR